MGRGWVVFLLDFFFSSTYPWSLSLSWTAPRSKVQRKRGLTNFFSLHWLDLETRIRAPSSHILPNKPGTNGHAAQRVGSIAIRHHPCSQRCDPVDPARLHSLEKMGGGLANTISPYGVELGCLFSLLGDRHSSEI